MEIDVFDARLRQVEIEHATTKTTVNNLSENQKQIIETQRLMAKADLERVRNAAIYEERFNSLAGMVKDAIEEDKQEKIDKKENEEKSNDWLTKLIAITPHLIVTAIFSALITAISTAYWLGVNHPH